RSVPAIGLRTTDGDYLHAIRSGFERANSLGSDAHHVPLAKLDHLAVDEQAPAAGDDDIRLLLLPVLVSVFAAEVRRVAEVADAEVARAQVLAPEPAFNSVDPAADRILDLEQVDLGERCHRPSLSRRWVKHVMTRSVPGRSLRSTDLDRSRRAYRRLLVHVPRAEDAVRLRSHPEGSDDLGTGLTAD